MTPRDLGASDRRVALVTGANKGIGLAVARGLCEAGLGVLIGCREESAGADAARGLVADGHHAAALPIDLSSASSVAQAAFAIDREVGRLDVLVNNAAVKHEFHPSPPSGADMDTVRATFDTNVFGTMQVMLAMLPMLERSTSPRVVNVSSGLGSIALSAVPSHLYSQRPLLSYNTSKAALNSMTVQFANEFRGTAFRINAADPGYVRTDMTGQDERGRTPEEGAAIIITLALLGDDGPTGGFFDQAGPVPW